MPPKILVTSALPYVNNVPHLGNIIGSTLSGDVYTRYLRNFTENEVLYLCGTDEYGTTTEIKAKQEGLSCQEICDKYHKIHKDTYDWFGIEFDVFGRTTTETQTEITHEIFNGLLQNGYVEKKILEQVFCNKCQMFLADRYLQGHCYNKECAGQKHVTNGDQCDYCGNFIDPEKLEVKWCQVCKSKELELKKSEHLYLKLGDLQELVGEYMLGPTPGVQLTPNAQAITEAWLNGELQSRCITRDLKWGTKVPSGILDKECVFYVWFDAPIGYMSILKHNRADWKEWMQSKMVNCIGSDNVVFHSIVYPATLLGSGTNYPLVSAITATNYLDFNGQKFSKSKGIGIFGDQVAKIGKRLDINSDYFRYYLIKIRPETKDSSFVWEDMLSVINADLVNKIGNLINRVVNLAKKFGGKFLNKLQVDNEITLKVKTLVTDYKNNFEKFKMRDAQESVLLLGEFGNGYLQGKEPWKLTDLQLVEQILFNSIYICRWMIQLLQPICPATCKKLLDVIEIKEEGYIINFDKYQLPFKKLDKLQVGAVLAEMKL